MHYHLSCIFAVYFQINSGTVISANVSADVQCRLFLTFYSLFDLLPWCFHKGSEKSCKCISLYRNIVVVHYILRCVLQCALNVKGKGRIHL